MANNEKKMISIGAMDEIMEERFPNTETIDYYGHELVVQKVIPFRLLSGIVRSVINTCFSEDGVYAPEKMEFALRICVIGAYTNVRLPDDAEHQYSILYRTDLWDTVMRFISAGQYRQIVNSISDEISVRNEANYAAFNRDVQKLVDEINSLGERFSDMFSSVTQDDIKGFMSAVSDGGIDEEQIVKAVVAEQNKQRGDVIQFPVADVQEPDHDLEDKDGE